MIKKAFRPFWSFDVKKTEQWLTNMAEQGFHFHQLNRHTRTFYFKEDQPKKITYEINYGPNQSTNLPNARIEDGWHQVFQKKKWSIIANEKPTSQIKTTSVRENIIKRNRTIFYVYCGLLTYFIGVSLIPLGIFLTALLSGTEIIVVESPYWIITYTITALSTLFVIAMIYSLIKIKKTNKQLIDESFAYMPMPDTSKQITKQKEKELIRAGKIVRKWKLNWMIAPDKLEEWLEKMESQGYNLYRVARPGTIFYFIREQKRNISYCTEYQNIAKESSFNMHKENGWKHVYSSSSTLQKWTIWSKEYEVAEVKPRIYTDKITSIKAARRIATSYSLLFIPIILLYSYMLTNWFFYQPSESRPTQGFTMFIFAVLILTFGKHTIKTWRYFFRVKNTT
ncbi:hypothetical protein BKP45_10025 [Anaerobacillus alkalidiazotrophicus]|uniref:DUF2812 domain-containing protein n=1 Tax=Anaerobacillus alkalidiazotrophicus TaxID=472963 RepID=A0A1S2M8G8_9BACI|nr:DUF2812 domain-containing protein [Anaerobacillus alkalidiazotrophicus]OIJ20117.1 hypothetical protein BKP45_10025 [Anaerobacillus alkalidiazotrophicus]